MLTTKNFNDRCDRLFDNMKNRFKARYWKTGKRAGTVKTPARELPFDRWDMRAFMAKQVGLNARPCAYCGAAIDILSLELDHIYPVSRGGSLGFGNLQCTCDACNREKGELKHEEYLELRAFIATLPPAAQSDLKGRLKGKAMRFAFPKKKGADPNAPHQRFQKYQSPQMPLEEPF
jgi:5-methylcytosine-specific restriction endonuclease McrA